MHPKHSVITKSPSISLSLWLCLLALTACGQRGPLYLPDDPPPVKQSQDESSQTPDEENDQSG